MQTNMLIATLALVALLSCGNQPQRESASPSSESRSEQSNEQVKLINRITSPSSKDIFQQGDNIKLKFSTADKYDSAQVHIDGRRVAVELNGDGGTIKSSEEWAVGRRKLDVRLFSGGESQAKSVSFLMLPKYAPKQYVAKITKTLPHDRGAYTQGYEFNEGRLLESSGQYDISYIAELEFPSMRELRRVAIDPELFAEGITVMDGKIYMLSWQEGVGQIFDRNTLEKISQWSYSTEGWGITNDGERLYMSDGTNNIYILDPETMQSTSRLEVATPKGVVNYLNELEWIDGKIWANLYGSSLIIVINPESGAVESVIDCEELCDSVSGEIDVLNGIAYNSDNGKIYLTGKLWPKSFEIELEAVK